MTSLSPTQVHHTVGNDLGGTQRPSGQLGWGELALSDSGNCRREDKIFQQLTRSMGEAEMSSKTFAQKKVGGPFCSERNLRSVIDQHQRTGTIAKQVGGLELASDPVLSRTTGNVVFIKQLEPGGSN